MARILIHVNGGPEAPARAASALLTAKHAIEQGHSVTLFLAGEAVKLVRDAASGNGGSVTMRHLGALVHAAIAKGARLYLSGRPDAARLRRGALARLSEAHDRLLAY